MVSKPPRPLPLLVCIAAIVVSEPMVSWLEEVNMRMTLPDSMSSIEDWMREREQSAADIVRKLTAPPDTLNYIINLGVLALLPGLCEEMFFRVGVQTRLFADKTFNTLVSYTVSAGVWSYKMLFEADTDTLYYIRKHKISARSGEGFTSDDLRKMARGR